MIKKSDIPNTDERLMKSLFSVNNAVREFRDKNPVALDSASVISLYDLLIEVVDLVRFSRNAHAHPIYGKRNPYVQLDETGASFSNPGGLITVHLKQINIDLLHEELELLIKIQESLILQKRLISLQAAELATKRIKREKGEPLTEAQDSQQAYIDWLVKRKSYSERDHAKYMAKKQKAENRRSRRHYRRRKE